MSSGIDSWTVLFQQEGLLFLILDQLDSASLRSVSAVSKLFFHAVYRPPAHLNPWIRFIDDYGYKRSSTLSPLIQWKKILANFNCWVKCELSGNPWDPSKDLLELQRTAFLVIKVYPIHKLVSSLLLFKNQKYVKFVLSAKPDLIDQAIWNEISIEELKGLLAIGVHPSQNTLDLVIEKYGSMRFLGSFLFFLTKHGASPSREAVAEIWSRRRHAGPEGAQRLKEAHLVHLLKLSKNPPSWEMFCTALEKGFTEETILYLIEKGAVSREPKKIHLAVGLARQFFLSQKVIARLEAFSLPKPIQSSL